MTSQNMNDVLAGLGGKWADFTKSTTIADLFKMQHERGFSPSLDGSTIRKEIAKEERPIPSHHLADIHSFVEKKRNEKMSEDDIRLKVKELWGIIEF